MGSVAIFPVFDGKVPTVNTIAAGAVGSGRLVDLPVPNASGTSRYFAKSVQDYFRWDATLATAADGITIVALLANGAAAGRYVRELVPAPEWLQTATWYIDAANGAASDEALDPSNPATPLLTDDERQRRMGPRPKYPLAEYHFRYPSNPTTPVNITGTFGLTAGNIYLHSSQTNGQGQTPVLATLAVDALTAVNHPTNVPLKITSNGLAVSWTADGLLNKRCRFTTGANIGGVVWPSLDLGAKQAQMSECQPLVAMANPLAFPQTTFAPALNDAFVVENLTTIATLRIDMTSTSNGVSNTVVADSVVVSSLSIQGNAAFYAWGSDYASTSGLQNNARAVSLLGCRVRANAKLFCNTGITLVNCYADDSASAPPIFTAASASFAIRCISVQRQGWKLIGAQPQQSAFFHKAWTIQTSFGIFNNTVASGLNVSGLNFDSAAEIWGVCQAGGTPIQLEAGNWLHYRAVVPGAASYYYIDVALAPGAAYISYNRAQNPNQTTAPTFDPATSIFTPYIALTPANLQATIAAGGLNGQWFEPLSGCGMGAI